MKSFKFSPAKYRGFTMIELLVILAIIAVLSTLAVSVYKEFTIQARDTKRISDIDSIHDALEIHYGSSTAVYSHLTASFFINHKIPQDPFGYQPEKQYSCGTSQASTQVCVYCFKKQSVGECEGARTPPYDEYAEEQMPSDMPFDKFIVCTNLERTFKGQHFYCRLSDR
jgi:prepilin-type N-terminal cleavage/methylation domain-containing protein